MIYIPIIFFGVAVVTMIYYSLLIIKLREIKIAFPCIVSKRLFLINIFFLIYAVICACVFLIVLFLN